MLVIFLLGASGDMQFFNRFMQSQQQWNG